MRDCFGKNKLKICVSAMLGVMLVYCLRPFLVQYVPFTAVRVCLLIIIFAAGAAVGFYAVKRLEGGWLVPVDPLPKKERNPGLDLVRVIACILVITVHYINGTGYYSSPAQGASYFMVTIARWVGQCCCPLFMLLSGYFLCNREVNGKHYGNLFHWFRNYVAICFFYLFFLGSNVVITADIVKSLVNLNYMWYINMYFGLFLLAPFLNILWKALDSGKKNVLLLVLLLLGSFSSVTEFWWTNYWNGLYPILYYYIGAWLRENPVKIKKLPGIFLLALMIILEAMYTFYIQPGQAFDWVQNFGGWSSAYNAFPTVLASALIFLLLRDIRMGSKIVRKLLECISQNSLEIYLALCMFLGSRISRPVHEYFLPRVGTVGVYFILLPLEVVAATLFGMALNKVLDALQRGVCKLFLSLRRNG